jgi:glutamyl/glutaminyl-tRNA synthetase
VALLGWNPAGGNNQEIFDMKQLENHFSLDKVNKSGSIVNPERLRWINSRHVRSLFDKTTSRHHQEKVISQVLPFITSSLSNPQEKETFLKSYGIDYIWKAMDLMKERVCALPEFGPLCIPFFETPDYTTKEALEMKQKYLKDPKLIHEIIEQVIDKLKELNDQKDFNAPTITKEIKSIANKNKLGLKS